jgi:hypothetical protein
VEASDLHNTASKHAKSSGPASTSVLQGCIEAKVTILRERWVLCSALRLRTVSIYFLRTLHHLEGCCAGKGMISMQDYDISTKSVFGCAKDNKNSLIPCRDNTCFTVSSSVVTVYFQRLHSSAAWFPKGRLPLKQQGQRCKCAPTPSHHSS